MDVLEPRQKRNIDDTLTHLFSVLSYHGHQPVLVGSSSLASNRYISDYDLLISVPIVPAPAAAFKGFESILQELYLKHRVYPVEFKLQTRAGIKVRWFPGDRFDYSTFEKYWKDVDFCKIDLVMHTEDNYFAEVSALYLFGERKRTNAEYRMSLEKDIQDFVAQGQYLKALKRYFSIARLLGLKRELVVLTRIFNSPLGALYQKVSQLQALNRLRQAYPRDNVVRKKIEIGLKDLKTTGGLRGLPKTIRDLTGEMNQVAEPIYREFVEGRLD